MVRTGKYRAEKTRYPDGVGVCLWEVMGDDEEAGLCYDFDGDALDDVIKLLQDLKQDEEKVYEPDPEYEAWEKKQEEKRKTLWYKLHRMIEDIGIHVTPFDWRWQRHLITRPIGTKGDQQVSKLCKGIQVGPVTLTW